MLLLFYQLNVFSDEFSCGYKCSCYTDVKTRALVADCSNQGLVEIPPNLPNYTNWLLISGNNISFLNMESSFLPHLTKLDISRNSLNNISNDFIDLFTDCHWKQLSLDISHNNLTTLPRNIQNISSITNLQLTGNSFQCNCENIWMKDWLNNSDTIDDSTNITCIMPGSSGKEIPMIDMSLKDMDCPVPESTTNWWKMLGITIISNYQMPKMLFMKN